MIAGNPKLLGSSGRVGLVLSGGGAKGAYQVGVIKCLSDYEIKIDAIAGASVGALNGALIASAPNLYDAGVRLEEIWTKMGSSPPSEIRIARAFPELMLSLYLSLLLASSRHSDLILLLKGVLRLARGDWSLEKTVKQTPTVAALIDLFGNADLDTDSSLASLINSFLDDEALARGLPFYVSVFRSKGVLMDLAWAAAGAFGLAETPDSEFLHVQSQDRADFRRSILASAALPLVFEAQTIAGRSYSDGGIGGWLKVQGNTPVFPLLRDAKCKYVIVTHLSDGSLWDRNTFPDAVVLEIRPGKPIARKGGLADTLGFNSSVVADWIEQGYEDTERCLLAAKDALDLVSAGRRAQLRLSEALSRLDDSDSQ